MICFHKCNKNFILVVTFLFSLNVFANDTSLLKTADTIDKNLFYRIDTPPRQVYKINIAGTLIAGVAATAANIIAINNIIHNKPDLTLEEVQAVNRNSVNRFDRWALDLDPTKRDKNYARSDHVLTGIFAMSGASILLNKDTRKDWLRLALMYYQTQFVTFAVYDFSPFGPTFQNKLRPVVYYSYFPIELRRRGNQKNSFYSGHVANATSATFFAVKVFSDYHPELGRKKYLLYGLASIPPLVNGWLRIKALAHFPSDVLAGYLIGGAFGILIPELHRIKGPRLQLNTYFDGYSKGMQLTWNIAPRKRELKPEILLR